MLPRISGRLRPSPALPQGAACPDDHERRQVFDLDQLGNWEGFQKDDDGPGPGDGGWDLEQTRIHDKVNQITDIDGGGWIDPDWTAEGNMATGPQPSGPGHTGTETTQLDFTYDAWNRLVKVVDHATTDTVAEYRYDGVNRRIRKYTDSSEGNWTVREYYYNSSWQNLEVRKDTKERTNNPLSEPDVATTVHEQYVWSLRYIDSPVLRDRDTDGNGLDERLYYLNDANFNVTALVDTNGDPVERYVYDPYGKVTIYEPDWSDTIDDWADSKKNEILYCGYRYDPETGLYNVRNRMHHPTVGRWMQRDPLQYTDGMNLYCYVGSSPPNWVDWNAAETSPAPSSGKATTRPDQQGSLGLLQVIPNPGPVHGEQYRDVKRVAKGNRGQATFCLLGCGLLRRPVAWRPVLAAMLSAPFAWRDKTPSMAPGSLWGLPIEDHPRSSVCIPAGFANSLTGGLVNWWIG